MCNQTCFAIVRNIPKSFHSADLRSFFSQQIEEELFSCFHYKHRPEVIKIDKDAAACKQQTNTCVVKFQNESLRQRFIDAYHDHNWISKDGDYLKEKCKIFKFSMSDKNKTIERQSLYLTRAEKRHRRQDADEESLSQSDLLQLSELKPPTNLMPNGNVGTPTLVFRKLVQMCLLPTSVIRKLGLSFGSFENRRHYSSVPFNYGKNKEIPTEKSTQPRTSKPSTQLLTAQGKVILNLLDEDAQLKNEEKKSSNTSQVENESESSEEESCRDDGEEWERHEAFHDDVTSQERSKERLFEEEIELKWEKGGSGLVFYTDAQYWAEAEGGFDEQTTDDWDVDMRVYYGEVGDKDARDFVQIQKEKRLHGGLDVSTSFKKRKSRKVDFGGRRIGEFEKHTKQFGRKMMEKMGWDDTQTLGASTKEGLKEPIEAEGQSARERRGLGYYGQKLHRNPTSKINSSLEGDLGSPFTSKGLSNKSAPQKVKLQEISSFPQQRSVEPLASHSWIFPQFNANLVALYNRHEPMTSQTRSEVVAGKEGIALTTVFDDPLQVDQDPGLLRSQHPAALKRRAPWPKLEEHPDLAPVKTGSKLVRTSSKDGSSSTLISNFPDVPLSYASVKFVRPTNPADRFV